MTTLTVISYEERDPVLEEFRFRAVLPDPITVKYGIPGTPVIGAGAIREDAISDVKQAYRSYLHAVIADSIEFSEVEV